MTLEHKILTLIDRGVAHLTDICAILDDDIRPEVLLFWSEKLLTYSDDDGVLLELSAEGVKRLNHLDSKGS